MKNKQYVFAIVLAALSLAACSGETTAYDATGVFEATEVTVSAEQNGKLVEFAVNEGDRINKDCQVGLIDTTQLALQMRQIGGTKQVYASQRPDVAKQVAATREQLAKAREEYARSTRLVSDGAAGTKTLDDARSLVQVLERQLEAQLSALRTSTNSLNAQMSTADAQRAIVADQLRKCHICSPVSGTVLVKYAEQGEFAAIGKPLFKVADISRVYLRAYVTSQQLKSVRLGQAVKVYADYGNNERREYAGCVTWISQEAEFTPKTVLTDDERADLVYAVKVAVTNDGYIKTGMYGEVKF